MLQWKDSYAVFSHPCRVHMVCSTVKFTAGLMLQPMTLYVLDSLQPAGLADHTGAQTTRKMCAA